MIDQPGVLSGCMSVCMFVCVGVWLFVSVGVCECLVLSVGMVGWLISRLVGYAFIYPPVNIRIFI